MTGRKRVLGTADYDPGTRGRWAFAEPTEIAESRRCREGGERVQHDRAGRQRAACIFRL